MQKAQFTFPFSFHKGYASPSDSQLSSLPSVIDGGAAVMSYVWFFLFYIFIERSHDSVLLCSDVSLLRMVPLTEHFCPSFLATNVQTTSPERCNKFLVNVGLLTFSERQNETPLDIRRTSAAEIRWTLAGLLPDVRQTSTANFLQTSDGINPFDIWQMAIKGYQGSDNTLFYNSCMYI